MQRKRTLVLASQSPRRKELLGKLEEDFLICPAVGEEIMDPNLAPSALVESLARGKAEEVAEKYPQNIVLGADTVVVVDGTIFGKPKDRAEAIEMLTKLQNNTHSVFTGVCLHAEEQQLCFSEETKVTLRPLSPEQIAHYVDLGESYDKAGAYGIQSTGACFIQGIEGDFFNVMGLPLCALGKVLPKFGISVFGEEDTL